MTNESSDVSAATPQQPSTSSRLQPPPAAEPAQEKAARDAEFAVFYRPEFPRLVGFLLVQGAGHLAADIAQEAMIETYRKWELLDRPGAWVRMVAQRRWWRLAADGRAEIPHDRLPDPCELLPPAAYEQIENRHVMLALLDGLTELQRQVLSWSYDGYHPTEISVVLGKDASTVRSALREARKKVRVAYRRGEESP